MIRSPEVHKVTLHPFESRGPKNWYRYNVQFEGKIIVESSADPEHDACRAMLALGKTGSLHCYDETGTKHRTIVPSIETAALYQCTDGLRRLSLRRLSATGWGRAGAED